MPKRFAYDSNNGRFKPNLLDWVLLSELTTVHP